MGESEWPNDRPPCVFVLGVEWSGGGLSQCGRQSLVKEGCKSGTHKRVRFFPTFAAGRPSRSVRARAWIA